MSASKDINQDSRSLFQVIRLMEENDWREAEIRFRREHMAAFLRRGQRLVLVRGLFGYQLEVRDS